MVQNASAVTKLTVFGGAGVLSVSLYSSLRGADASLTCSREISGKNYSVACRSCLCPVRGRNLSTRASISFRNLSMCSWSWGEINWAAHGEWILSPGASSDSGRVTLRLPSRFSSSVPWTSSGLSRIVVLLTSLEVGHEIRLPAVWTYLTCPPAAPATWHSSHLRSTSGSEVMSCSRRLTPGMSKKMSSQEVSFRFWGLLVPLIVDKHWARSLLVNERQRVVILAPCLPTSCERAWCWVSMASKMVLLWRSLAECSSQGRRRPCFLRGDVGGSFIGN